MTWFVDRRYLPRNPGRSGREPPGLRVDLFQVVADLPQYFFEVDREVEEWDELGRGVFPRSDHRRTFLFQVSQNSTNRSSAAANVGALLNSAD